MGFKTRLLPLMWPRNTYLVLGPLSPYSFFLSSYYRNDVEDLTRKLLQALTFILNLVDGFFSDPVRKDRKGELLGLKDLKKWI